MQATSDDLPITYYSPNTRIFRGNSLVPLDGTSLSASSTRLSASIRRTILCGLSGLRIRIRAGSRAALRRLETAWRLLTPRQDTT
ncbi:hypothetical protein CYMTET_34837 [Cymbomonas tetramitiformis]|uniref:Uncharacterized protein n=1 Tax=Cymbomonas tetramitiformis TaxID=36881 RepID=A0AAE0KPK1_9CHLO|nr:hypothetical protein CYMTET_34837 [Cymbomonas tetramitiformis]